VGEGTRAEGRERAWPDIPYEAWADTKNTLRLYTQIVGKVMLALCPDEPEWGHVALRLTARGLSTGPMPCSGTSLEIVFDFEAHACTAFTAEGTLARCELEDGLCVADFYAWLMQALADICCPVEIWTKPQEIADTTPLDTDRQHCSYDGKAVNAWFRAQASIAKAVAAWLAPFRGPKTRVQWWWGSFDLSAARFSGRAAPAPADWGVIGINAMDAEEVAVGFWPGDERYPEAAIYGYAYPKPDGFEQWRIEPAEAAWSDALGEFVLPYAAIREAEDPQALCLRFFDSVYEAGATLGSWPRDQWERPLAQPDVNPGGTPV